MRKLLFTLPLLALAACATETAEPTTTLPPDGVEVVKSELLRADPSAVPYGDQTTLLADYATFTFDFYKEASKGTGGIVVSPYSATNALAMAAAGARGETRSEIAKALRLTLPADRLDPAMNWLDLAIRSSQRGVSGQETKLSNANALFSDRTVVLSTPFLDTLAQSYGAGVHKVDFRSDAEGGRKTVNAWVERQTEKRILDLVPTGSIDQQTRFVLVNAMYFAGKWANEFSKTQTAAAPFTRLDGSTTNVPTMHQELRTGYVATDAYEAISLPFDTYKTSMVFIAPKAGQFSGFESKLDAKAFAAVLGGLEAQKLVELSLPKFKEEADLRLVPVLQNLGMTKAFTGDADFGAISSERFRITDVIQKAFLKIDEEGAEAAAATAVLVGGSAAPVDPPIVVKIDRPFITAIIDNRTKAVLFLSRVVDPK